MTRQFESTPYNLAVALLAALMLSACGGGGGSTPAVEAPADQAPPGQTPAGQAPTDETPTVQAPEPTGPLTPPHPISEPLPAEIDDTFTGRYVRIGPAFANQRPDLDDLETRSAVGGFEVGSGRWRDRRGRDGSASAAEVVRFIQSMQRQADREGGGDLVFVDLGVQKTLRIDSSTRASERRAVLAALRNINTSLPWERRILLGPDLSERVATEDIPEDEIHVYFTNGKADWPEDDEGDEYGDMVLGIGGVNLSSDGPTVLGGYTYIDRNAIGPSSSRLEFVVTHELLHAWGIGAHADPDSYPNFVLVPRLPNNLNQVPRLWRTVEGEALLAMFDIPPGTLVSDLTVADLGPWEDDGFHLVSQATLGETNSERMQFGAGFRNGLGRPWAWGSRPGTQLRDNPEMSGQQMASWVGSLLGFTGAGRPVAGGAEIGIDFASLEGRAEFTDLESWDEESHPGEPGSGLLWGDGDLAYTIGVGTEAGTEVFISTFADGDDPGVVTGAFVGAGHEGAVGVLEHPDLSAAFGAKR